jgi:hypothetical protein
MTLHTRMMTGRKTVIATKRKKMPAPMKAAKYVNCAADGMLHSRAARKVRGMQRQHVLLQKIREEKIRRSVRSV